jgi:hypothetical protein
MEDHFGVSVSNHFETFIRLYDEHFSRQYGFWRPYIEQMIYRYLDCGDLHNGFALVKCKDCGHKIPAGLLLQVLLLSIGNIQCFSLIHSV